MLVMMMSPPAAVPRTRGDRWRTIQAANGAAITPPTSSAAANAQLMPAAPRPKRKPIEALTATTNSEALMEPTTLRGSTRPDESRVVVPTGPHPPPPNASRVPPAKPSGTRKRAEIWPENWGRLPPSRRKR